MSTPNQPAPMADGGAAELPGSGDAGVMMGTGGTSGTVEDDCTEQRLRAQFAKEYTVGGCQDSTFHGCHGGTTDDPQLPNLLAEDLVKELVGGSNPTRENQGKCGVDYPNWITAGAGLDQSLLWSKASSTDEPGHGPFCGDPMPPRDGFAMQMPPEELECLSKWILRVSMGPH